MIQIDTTNGIVLDNEQTGLKLVQRREGTIIYTPENKLNNIAYREHKMPESRYATSHDAPDSGVAGCATLETDIRALLEQLASA